MGSPPLKSRSKLSCFNNNRFLPSYYLWESQFSSFFTTADPMLTGASITTAHGSVHGQAPVEPFTANPVHIQYPQHYSSPVIQTHHHSTPSSIFTPGRSLGSDSYLVGDPGLSSEPSFGSLSVDEVKRPDSQNCY